MWLPDNPASTSVIESLSNSKFGNRWRILIFGEVRSAPILMQASSTWESIGCKPSLLGALLCELELGKFCASAFLRVPMVSDGRAFTKYVSFGIGSSVVVTESVRCSKMH